MSAPDRRTIAERLWPANDAAAAAIRFVTLMVAGSLLLTLSAKVLVPFFPVHMTMQTFVVMALAVAFGWRLGVATVLFYLAEGALGLPVFTGTPEKGIGLAYMVGPTGGYLLGFVAQAAIVGYAAERWAGRSVVKLGAAMLVADAVMLMLGVAWLAVLFGVDKPILAWGLYPFVLGDLTKVALAAIGVPAVWGLVDRLRSR